MKCCVSTDVGTSTNCLSFEPDPDYSREPNCFLRYRTSAGTRNFTSGKSHVYVLARPAAAATRGFKMVLFTQPSKQLCRRYMRSTECPSSWSVSLTYQIFMFCQKSILSNRFVALFTYLQLLNEMFVISDKYRYCNGVFTNAILHRC